MNSKKICRIFKIESTDDEFTVYIGSTLKKISQNFINDLILKTKSLQEWTKNLPINSLKINQIKKYIIRDTSIQKIRETSWIKKYENYGFIVISNTEKNENHEENKSDELIKNKISVVLKNISIQELTSILGDKLISFSILDVNSSPTIPPPQKPNKIKVPPPPTFLKPVKIGIKTENKVENKNNKNSKKVFKNGNGYLDELKYALNNKNYLKTEVLKKKKIKKIKKTKTKENKKVNLHEMLMKEIKNKFLR